MEDHKGIIKTFFERLWNQRKLEFADTIVASDCRTHQLRSGAPLTPVPRGPEAIKAHVSDWLTGFPDLRFTIEQMLAEGDRVLTQLIMDGTHTGPFWRNPAHREAREYPYDDYSPYPAWEDCRGLGPC